MNVNEILGGIQKELIIGLIISIFGLIVLLFALKAIKKAKASSQWLTAEGEITKSIKTESKVKKGDITTYDAEIEYKYTVNGREYTSDRIYFGSSISIGGGEIKSSFLFGKYYASKKVTVFYNPEDEEESVLETGIQNELYWVVAISIIIIAFGIFFAWNNLTKA